MDHSRWLPIGVAALFSLAAAAWMMPPTRPVAPVSYTNALHPHPRASDPVVPPPDDAAMGDIGVMQASPPPAGSGLAEAYPPATPSAVTAAPRSPPARARETDDTELAHRRDQSQAAFLWGYRWAERNDIEDVEDCGAWRGSSREEGCRAFVQGDDEPSSSEEDASPP